MDRLSAQRIPQASVAYVALGRVLAERASKPWSGPTAGASSSLSHKNPQIP